MKFLRWLPIAVAAVGISSTAAADYSSLDGFNERDFESVTNFIKCKRGIPLQEKACDLMISGDVRFQWENIKEKVNDNKARGKGAPYNASVNNGERTPTNQFDVEFNLMLDYRSANNCTWAVAHLEFDNNAGVMRNPRGCCGKQLTGSCNPDGSIAVDSWTHGDPSGLHGSGTTDRLCLRKAFFGWNMFEQCNSRIDIEVGRRALYDVFDSRVMFGSAFDGVLVRYSNSFECVGDFYTNLGGFVIDENANHWGWVVEAGLLDIADLGFDLKYSFIHWAKNGTNRCNVNDPVGAAFATSQLYAAYNFNPEFLCSRAKVYGAILLNHDAKDLSVFYQSKAYNYGKQDLGWYVGFLVGDVCKEGDWSLDVNYQYVERNVFPEFDLSGIGRGNIYGIPTTINPAFGWLNYHGVRAEMLYALTDNLTLHPSWEYSTNIKDFVSNADAGYTLDGSPQEIQSGKKVDNDYSRFELELIYAF